jgi:DNA-binding GntR family transcriptional regulator
VTSADLNPDLRTDSLADSAYGLIRNRILDGDLGVGAPVSVLGLATDLEMSRSPVRNAVERLLSERLLRRVAGTIAVAAPDRYELLDSLAVRTQLEALAARLAAPRIDEGTLEELVVIHDRFRGAVDSGDQDGARRADSDFHHAIQDLAGNECLAESLERVRTQVILGAYATAWVTSRGPAVLEHERVLRALEDQDGQAAETAMIRHLDNLTTRITREWRAQDTAEDATTKRRSTPRAPGGGR